MDGMISLVEEFVYDRLWLFLASRTQIMPYLYYHAIDKLLRFKNPLSYGPPQQEPEETGLTGSMVLYMLLRANTMVSKHISASLAGIPSVPRCGWKEALETSGLTYMYIKVILPEQSAAKSLVNLGGKSHYIKK